MDIYTQRSGWKVLFGIVGLSILGITLYYSNYLAQKLEETEEKNKVIYVESLFFIATNKDYNADISLQSYIQDQFSLPLIMEEVDGSVSGFHWGGDKNNDVEYLKAKVKEFIDSGQEPIDYAAADSKIYIFNSPLVRLIKLYPIVQVLLVGLFIALGYYIFNTSRGAEQNRVWAGMAKETAHQLGTPISAIIAWIEHLKLSNNDNPDQLEILEELTKDVDRLDLIADRFSKIGSAPELEKTDLFSQLNEIKNYMQRRASRRVKFLFPAELNNIDVNINKHLFSWVLENLIRNSLDAMGGSGEIAARVEEEGDMVSIFLSDTGKGIPANKFKTIFAPGYSTKQRGWGLGLSLAKRIIENYHKGKIFVKSSKLNEGTTFAIKLPRA